MTIFQKMLTDRRWLYRPWIPFLKAVEGESFLEHPLKAPVLDLACGDGVFAEAVYDIKIDVGLDLDTESLKRADGKYHSIIHGDATSLPFEDETFQTAISACALEHIPDLEKALSEVRRVLKPGGVFIFSVPSIYFGDMLLKTRLLKAVGLKKQAEKYIKKKNSKSRHIHIYELSKWQETLVSCNLKPLSYEYCLSNNVMLLWSFMTSFIFKLFILPFRLARDYNIKPIDDLLRRILILLFGKRIINESRRKLSSGGYLVLAAARE